MELGITVYRAENVQSGNMEYSLYGGESCSLISVKEVDLYEVPSYVWPVLRHEAIEMEWEDAIMEIDALNHPSYSQAEVASWGINHEAHVTAYIFQGEAMPF